MNRDQALQQLHKWVNSPSLRRHCYTVEKVMRNAAGRYGGTDADPQAWGLVGLLHDADYEQFPDEHPKLIVEWLREHSEFEMAYAISAHWTKWNIPHRTALDRALLACDELTGFIVACALLRPDGILSLEVPSVIKKLKNPKFAANVERDEIRAGVRLLNVDIEDHIAFIIDALRPHAIELGIDGNAACQP